MVSIRYEHVILFRRRTFVCNSIQMNILVSGNLIFTYCDDFGKCARVFLDWFGFAIISAKYLVLHIDVLI